MKPDSNTAFPNTRLIKRASTALLALIMTFSVNTYAAETNLQESSGIESKQSLEQAQLLPFTATYKAFKNGKERGSALMKLEKQGEQYKLYYESEASIFFFSDRRTETSLFQFLNGKFQQLEYHYTREGTGPDKFLDLTFDAKSGKITKNSKDGSGEFNWQGEWDNQLYRFDLQSKIKERATDISYNLVNYRGQLKTYGFEIVGEEVLELPFGKLNTIKVRTIRSNKKRETFSWFAPDLNYQLVRLQQFKKGKEQGDIKLSGYSLQ